MTKVRKTALWILCGAGGLILLLFLLFGLLAPKLVHLDAVKSRLLGELSERAGIQGEFRKIRFSFFPTPRLIIRDVTLELPEKMTATVDSLTLVPRLLPLLKGDLKPGAIRMRSPQVSMVIPELMQEEAPGGNGFSAAEAEKKIRSIMSVFQLDGQDLTVTVVNATLGLWDPRNNHYGFKHVNARAAISQEKLELQLSGGQSTLWESIEFNGWLIPADFRSSGKLVIKGSLPEPVQAYCYPNAPMRVGYSKLDVDLSFSSEGPRTLRASFDASTPLITLSDGCENLELKNGSASGSITLEGRKLDVTLGKLVFNYPQVNLTGRFLRDPAARNVSIELQGKDMDVAAVRRVTLALQGDRQAIQKVFEIIQAGQVPAITYTAHGEVMADLKKPENHLIRGSIHHATVYIPKIQLQIDDAAGDAVITNNILEGTNLVGRTGNSLGSEGLLKVALTGGDGPFHLDIMIDADISELPPVLHRVVKNDPFQRELALIKNVKGKTRGRMILGETLQDVKTRLEVGEFELSADYTRVPQRMDLHGGSLFFEDRTISMTALTARFGKSVLSQMDLAYRWDGEPQMQLTARQGTRISLDEVYPLLLTIESVKAAPKAFEPLNGTLNLDSVRFQGPLLKPQAWSLAAKGAAEDALIQCAGFPYPITAKRGKLEATQDKLTLNGFETNFQDAALTVSGTLGNLFKGVSSVDLAMRGTIGPQANETISGLFQLPPQFRAISPLSVSNSHLVWEKGGVLSMSMDMFPPDGPKVSIDVQGLEDGVEIKHLSVKDDESDAFITLKLRKKAFKLGFFGVLSNKSLDRLLVKNELLTGWIKGTFQAYVRRNQPMTSTARGELQAAGFVYSYRLQNPARIESAYIQARGSKIRVKSADITWQDSKLSLKGGVTFSPSGFKFDMDLAADTLDYEKLKQLQKNADDAKSSAQEPGRKDLKLRGMLRVKADRFTFGKMTWNPVEANVYFGDEGTNVEIKRADLCGIGSSGAVHFSGGKAQFALQPEARGGDLDSALTCLWDKKGLLTGKFDLKGNMSSDDAEGDITSTLAGELELNAKNGRIRRFELLAKIFKMINFTEIFRGVLPDLLNEGCAYDTIKARGKFQEGKLIFENSVVDGACVRMVWHGEIDLVNKKIDITVIVAPFRTVDRIIDKVPLVGKWLNGSLISIPVKVSGDLSDPTVIPLSPTAVGVGLAGFMKRTFELPFSLFQPFTNGAKPK